MTHAEFVEIFKERAHPHLESIIPELGEFFLFMFSKIQVIPYVETDELRNIEARASLSNWFSFSDAAKRLNNLEPSTTAVASSFRTAMNLWHLNDAIVSERVEDIVCWLERLPLWVEFQESISSDYELILI